MKSGWNSLTGSIVDCTRCPRLRRHCQAIATTRRKAFAGEQYWGKPVPGFGDPAARLVVLGLAPAAHGANRTGRVFTGDRSGLWLYRALHKAGFANQATSTHRDDGLRLQDAFITATVKCAPPDNKPTTTEIARCLPFLEKELDLLTGARVYLALGKLAFDEAWALLKARGLAADRSRPRFAHNVVVELEGQRWLVASYHPSQQNTFTGKLTEPMFDAVFTRSRNLLGG